MDHQKWYMQLKSLVSNILGSTPVPLHAFPLPNNKFDQAPKFPAQQFRLPSGPPLCRLTGGKGFGF